MQDKQYVHMKYSKSNNKTSTVLFGLWKKYCRNVNFEVYGDQNSQSRKNGLQIINHPFRQCL